ncbi:MAG: peptidoglycan DD-metalloendopeptidase family protein [Bacilli bacterium]|nr:peptidoglycan DD-metalloendopeptidase family protein [Bacilli bacterium]
MLKRSTKILLLCLITMMIIIPNTIKADRITFGDALDELAELERQKEEKENEIAITQEQYDKLSNEIYQIQIEIENLSKEIQKANEEIDKLGKEIESKKEETDNILVFLQLSSGEKSYLEYVFKAKSFTDFIHRVSVVEQLSKYNKEQIGIMNDLIVQNNKLKEKNKETIKKQEIKREESRIKMAELGSRINELVKDEAPIEKQIATLEAEIQRMRDSGCRERSDKLSVCYPLITATGFLRPLKSGTVSSEYSWRILNGQIDSHSGIDLAVPEWTPVYPVAAGRVEARFKTNCGGQMIYVYHNIKGEQYTSVYMHLVAFGDYKAGDIVTAEDVIGYTGGSSTATYNGGYDDCTFGAHLHLTLATGHTTSHRRTMFNPREKINFPPMWQYWYSRTW